MSTPKQITLAIEDFPTTGGEAQLWAKNLVEAFNQLSLQTTQSISELVRSNDRSEQLIGDASGASNTKTLTFKTGASVAASFPIDVAVAEVIRDVKVAMILAGDPSGAVTVVAKMLSGGRRLRISNITGLATNTKYSIRLSLGK